jgi:hypothetical protein
MKSKRNKPSYSGWTDQTLNDASIDSILDKFIKKPSANSDFSIDSEVSTNNALSENTSDLAQSQITINHLQDQKIPQNRLPENNSLLENHSPAYQNNSLLKNNRLPENNSLPKTNSLLPTNLWLSIEPVKGHLKLPHIYTDGLARLLDPAEQVIYLQLFRLSWGYGKDKCTIGLPKLAQRANVSRSTAQQAIKKLVEKNLVEKIDWEIGYGKEQGTIYRLPISNSLLENNSLPETTPIKDKDHDDLKRQDHHQSNNPPQITEHQKSMMMIYQNVTGNVWTKADLATYQKIKNVPLEAIEIAIKLATQRASSRPNSLAFFVKEIIATANPKTNRSKQKKSMEKIVDRLRNSLVGSSYSMSDFVYKVKESCLREDIAFDNDLLDELLAKKNS